MGHIYPTMMKLGTLIPYQKKIQKYINYVMQPLSSADISIFSREISKYQEILIQIVFLKIHFHIFLTFFIFKHGYNFDDVGKNCYSRPS